MHASLPSCARHLTERKLLKVLNPTDLHYTKGGIVPNRSLVGLYQGALVTGGPSSSRRPLLARRPLTLRLLLCFHQAGSRPRSRVLVCRRRVPRSGASGCRTSSGRRSTPMFSAWILRCPRRSTQSRQSTSGGRSITTLCVSSSGRRGGREGEGEAEREGTTRLGRMDGRARSPHPVSPSPSCLPQRLHIVTHD